MRYTKYAYNKKNKNNFLISLVIVIILGSVTGGLLFKLLFKNVCGLINGTNNVDNISTGVVKNNDYEKIFMVVQCGVFKEEENAKELANNLTNYNPFIIEENGVFKVICGIFDNKNDGNKINKALVQKGIEGYLIKFDLSRCNNDLEYEIIKGYIKILNKVAEDDIKSINTKEFKKWVLKNTKKSTNKEVKELVENIQKLPPDINKENNKDILVYLYKFLIKYKI